jgi:hypothetical protein
MPTLRPSASQSRNLKIETERTAFRRLFWERDIMQIMREEKTDNYTVYIPHAATAAELLTMIFGEGPIQREPDDMVVFMLHQFRVGDERWGAIAAGINYELPLRIIEPFPMPDHTIAGIPLFKEEL